MKVYLCGPINGCTDDQAIGWRDQVQNHLGEDACIDPMRRDYRGIEDESVNEIVRGDLADIKDCSVIIANCWQPSFGTAMELWHAHAGGAIFKDHRPIVTIAPEDGPVSPWLRYVSTVVVHTVEDAIMEAIRLG